MVVRLIDRMLVEHGEVPLSVLERIFLELFRKLRINEPRRLFSFLQIQFCLDFTSISSYKTIEKNYSPR